MLLIVGVGFSQSLTNNGMTISVKSNTIFSVGENATNNGTIINNGSFLIAGAWVNNGIYDAGTGDFTLNSPGDQIVNHNAQSFERLIIRGGGNKIFQADITINDDITLQDGVLMSTNGARLFISENAQITGGSSSSYIAGPLYMSIQENAFFPIGTTNTYLPVSLSNIDGTNAILGFEAISPNPVTTFDGADEISSDYAWQMTVESGTYNNAIITLPVVNQTFVENMEGVLVMQASSLSDSYVSLGQSNNSGDNISGEVTSESTATGAFFTIGYLADEEGDGALEAISVVNAITPATQDGKHDFLKIENIEQHPNNKVSIYNRWGDLVYEVGGYNNNDVIFTGETNVGNRRNLDNGTYFYAIEAGGEVKSGFFVIRR